MKILKTLQSLLSKVEKKEAGRFREYAIYKKKKKLLLLFDVLYKHDKTVELEYLQFYLKEKKVHQNLRNSSKQLYKLILGFWNECPPEVDIDIEIGKLIHSGSILAKRGLIQEGLDLFKEAKEIAEIGEKYNHQIEILRLSTYWTNILKPKKALDVLKKAETEAEALNKKLHVNLVANIESSKVHITTINCKGSYSEEDLKTFANSEKVALQLLTLDECTLRSKLACHSILSQIHFTTPTGKDRIVEYHLLETIKMAEPFYDSDKKKFGAILISRLVSLLYLYLAEKERPEPYQRFLEKFRTHIKAYRDKDLHWGYFHYEIELMDCLNSGDFSRAEEEMVPATLEFIEINAKKITKSRLWRLHSLCFQVKFSMAKFEDAEPFLMKMNQNDIVASLDNLYKFSNRLHSLFYNYELKNYQLVDNIAKSTRRLYTGFLEGNPGGKLLLSNLIKLSNALNHSERILIFQSLQKAINELTKEGSFYYRIIGFNILTDWINSKVHDAKTIQEYKTANLVKDS